MNTASGNPVDIANANPRVAGAGVVQVDRASTTLALATAPSLSFGYEPLGGAYSETLPLTIDNASSSDITYDVGSAFNGAGLGTDVTIQPAVVTVPAGGSTTVDVTLTLTAAEVAALPAASQAPGTLVTVRGVVTATPTAAGPGVYPLRIPFLLAPRGLSDVTVSGTPVLNGSATLTVSNGGIHEGAADEYAWGQTDPADLAAGSGHDIRSVGVQVLPGELGGLAPSDRLLVFAINTHGKWSSASQSEFDIAIDVTGSPAPEFFVVGVDLGAVLAGAFNSQYASFVITPGGVVVDAFFADAPMNGSTVLLPVAASSLGLSQAEFDRFRFDTTGFSIFGGPADAVAGNPRVRPWAPTSSSGGFVPLAPGGLDDRRPRRRQRRGPSGAPRPAQTVGRGRRPWPIWAGAACPSSWVAWSPRLTRLSERRPRRPGPPGRRCRPCRGRRRPRRRARDGTRLPHRRAVCRLNCRPESPAPPR
jgi:hypothetical protein